jgi:NTP pyrophosphatase (non-canonical NTP hydrolase)
VASEAGELLAEYRWIRSNEADDCTRDEQAKAWVSDESADVAIAIILFCDRVGIRLTDAIDRKLESIEPATPLLCRVAGRGGRAVQ